MQPLARYRRATLPNVTLVATPAILVTASYLAAMATAEVMLLTSGLLAGALAHALLLLALIAHYVAAPHVGYRRLLLALALPPLMRMIGLAVPIATTTPVIWIVAAGTPTLLAALLCARAIDADPRGMLRLRLHEVGPQLAVAAGGIMHGLLGYLALRPAPIIGQLDVIGIGTAVVALGVFAAFTEELIFRGIIQAVASQTFANQAAGAFVSALVFALMYLASMSIPLVLLMFAIGLFFSWIVQESRTLWGVIGAHMLLSVGMLVAWPILLR
jgi:membrane protease YdiL (CAAX protease family)